MIKVLQFVEGLSQGGIESFVTNIYKHVNLNEFQCDFLVLKTAQAANLTYVYEKELTERGAKIWYLVNDTTLRKKGIPKSIKYLQLFCKWMKSEGRKYDVIHVHASHLANFYPYLVCMKIWGAKKIVLHSHNSTIDSRKTEILHKIFRKMLKPLHPVCLACGQAAGAWMYGNLHYEIIPNGIDLQKFRFSDSHRELVRKELGFSENLKILGHVGAFRGQKNHRYLIEVFQRYYQEYEDSRLLLVGDGELRMEIQTLIKQKGLKNKVVFLGNRKDIYRILSAIDCFVFPSLYEGLSVAMVEVQANGVPAVISNTIAAETVMCNKICRVPIDDEEGCYRKWCSLIQASIENGRVGIQYSDRFYDYDIKNTVNRLETIYKKRV